MKMQRVGEKLNGLMLRTNKIPRDDAMWQKKEEGGRRKGRGKKERKEKKERRKERKKGTKERKKERRRKPEKKEGRKRRKEKKEGKEGRKRKEGRTSALTDWGAGCNTVCETADPCPSEEA